MLLIISGVLLIAPVSGQGAALLHDYIEVDAQSYQYVEIYVDKPSTTITIIAYIYTSGGSQSDIDVEVIRPDGGLELAKRRYQDAFKYGFVASMTGTYRLLLDNSYSILTNKIVDLAIVKYPPPTTITRTTTRTLTRTETIRQPVTTTITETVSQPPITVINTETVTSTETVTVTPMESILSVAGVGVALLVAGLVVGLLVGRHRAKEK